MWRTRAVVAMLIEEIAGLSVPADGQAPIDQDESATVLGTLTKAIRRAHLVIGLDWIAITILFLFRDPSRPFLPVDQTVDTIFTLGVLAIATHAGFRWGTLERYRAVNRLCDELRERDE